MTETVLGGFPILKCREVGSDEKQKAACDDEGGEALKKCRNLRPTLTALLFVGKLCLAGKIGGQIDHVVHLYRSFALFLIGL